MKKKKPKKVIGRHERADFPELGIEGIDAKIDTGAYTSSIHCEKVFLKEKDGKLHVAFTILDAKHKGNHKRNFLLPVFKEKIIKNSFGDSESRVVIKTKIILFEEVFEIELSLADRSAMEYPVLLGRKLLKKSFVVDVSKINCSYKAKMKRNENPGSQPK